MTCQTCSGSGVVLGRVDGRPGPVPCPDCKRKPLSKRGPDDWSGILGVSATEPSGPAS